MDWTTVADRFLNPFRGPTHLTLADQVAIAKAPKLAPQQLPPMHPPAGGTEVRIEAYPAQPPLHVDHMFAHYDDGQRQYIYRGGDRSAWLHAQVDPVAQSPDRGKGERILGDFVLPGQTADQAIQGAKAHAQENNEAHRVYGYWDTNSNSLMGDFTQRNLGRRVGDARTWGYGDRLDPPGFDPLPAGVYRPTNPIW